MKFAYRNCELCCKGYYADTVCKDTAAIKEYMKIHQLKRDKDADLLSVFDLNDYNG